MKRRLTMYKTIFGYALLSLGLLAGEARLQAQDNITIPKSRLEELERKEKELERLQKNGTQGPAISSPKAPATALAAPTAVASAPPAVPRRDMPTISSLPPLKEGQILDALDLMAYYKQDPIAAEQRFKNLKLTLRGAIYAFEKPLITRNYYVLLDTGDRDSRLVCDFVTPSKYNSVYPARHGSELIANEDQKQTTLAKTGQVVLIKGKCKKYADRMLKFQADELISAP